MEHANINIRLNLFISYYDTENRTKIAKTKNNTQILQKYCKDANQILFIMTKQTKFWEELKS